MKLQIYSKSKGKSSLHPSWDENTILERNQPNLKNLKHHLPKKTSHQINKNDPQPSQLLAASEVDPNMPPLEDVDPPKKKFKFITPSTVKPKCFFKK